MTILVGKITEITSGFVHNTLALTIAECMGSQWASRLATLVIFYNLEF